MIINELSIERNRRPKRKVEPIRGWFFGRLDWAERILKTLGDNQSTPNVFWTVRFTHEESLLNFLYLWPDARRVRVPENGKLRTVWVIPDIVCFQFLRDRGGVVLAPAVEIEFADCEKRAAFRAYLSHSPEA